MCKYQATFDAECLASQNTTESQEISYLSMFNNFKFFLSLIFTVFNGAEVQK